MPCISIYIVITHEPVGDVIQWQDILQSMCMFTHSHENGWHCAPVSLFRRDLSSVYKPLPACQGSDQTIFRLIRCFGGQTGINKILVASSLSCQRLGGTTNVPLTVSGDSDLTVTSVLGSPVGRESLRRVARDSGVPLFDTCKSAQVAVCFVGSQAWALPTLLLLQGPLLRFYSGFLSHVLQ